MSRQNISSGAPWEDKVGYSRAVRIGNIIEISGTVALKEGVLVGENDAYLQTQRVLEIIEETLSSAGSNLEDVIRTRIFTVNIDRDWQVIGQAHGEVFGQIKPATSMVEVNKLIAPEYLLEIEVTAVIAD